MWFEASIAKKEEVRRKAWQRERERESTYFTHRLHADWFQDYQR
jgi:hypothetical protein